MYEQQNILTSACSFWLLLDVLHHNCFLLTWSCPFFTLETSNRNSLSQCEGIPVFVDMKVNRYSLVYVTRTWSTPEQTTCELCLDMNFEWLYFSTRFALWILLAYLCHWMPSLYTKPFLILKVQKPFLGAVDNKELLYLVWRCNVWHQPGWFTTIIISKARVLAETPGPLNFMHAPLGQAIFANARWNHGFVCVCVCVCACLCVHVFILCSLFMCVVFLSWGLEDH